MVQGHFQTEQSLQALLVTQSSLQLPWASPKSGFLGVGDRGSNYLLFFLFPHPNAQAGDQTHQERVNPFPYPQEHHRKGQLGLGDGTGAKASSGPVVPLAWLAERSDRTGRWEKKQTDPGHHWCLGLVLLEQGKHMGYPPDPLLKISIPLTPPSMFRNWLTRRELSIPDRRE